MRVLFGGGHRPLLKDPFDDLIGKVAWDEDVFRGWLEEANDALVVGDDEEGEVIYSESREGVVGDDKGWSVEEELSRGFRLSRRWIGGTGWCGCGSEKSLGFGRSC